MKIELLAIGDEVLAGKTVNTNGAYLAARFWEEGILVSYQQVIPDNPEIISQTLREAFKRSDLIVTCGGLGPTQDDRTRQVVASFFNQELVFFQEIYDKLMARFKKAHKGVENQAMQPKGAKIFHNSVGTAPGVWLEEGQKILIMLPGVPAEMKALWDEQIFLEVLKKIDGKKREGRRFISICTVPEIVVDEKTQELLRDLKTVSYGIYPDLGLVQLVLKGGNSEELDQAQAILKKEFGNKVFSEAVECSIEKAVYKKLIEMGKTLSLAESCTGGAIATRVTSQSGCSRFFLGGAVCYSNDSKEKLLGVRKETLKKYGAVSKETAKEMAEGACREFNSDYALSVTGIAGPEGGTLKKPVGLVYGGIKIKGIEEPEVWEINIKTSRLSVIRALVNYSLSKLWLKINDEAL